MGCIYFKMACKIFEGSILDLKQNITYNGYKQSQFGHKASEPTYYQPAPQKYCLLNYIKSASVELNV